MISIKNLLKLNPVRSGIIVFSCIISTLLTVFVRYNLTWQADALRQSNIQLFLILTLVSLGAYTLASTLNHFGNYFLLDKTIQRYSHNIRKKLLEKYDNDIVTSKVQNDLINNIEVVENQYFGLLAALFENICLFLFSVLAILSINWIILVSTLFLAILLLKIPDLFKKIMQKRSIDTSTQTQIFLEKIANWVAGIDVLRRFNGYTIYSNKLKNGSFQYTSSYLENIKVGKLVSLIVILSNVTAQLMIFALTGALILSNQITIGVIFSIGGLIGYTFSYVVIIANGLLQMKNGKAIIDQINGQIIKASSKNSNEKDNEDIKYYVSNLSVKFSNGVDIRYPNIEINRGDKILLTGPSGSGKTTFFKLFLNQLEANTGMIGTIDRFGKKHPIDQNKVAYIPQEPILMPVSIIDNITMFEPSLKESALKVIKKVNFKKDILKFKDGINTIVQVDKNNMSGGQKQKIVLARTLLYEKPLLLVDEGTSAIDANSTQEILKTVTNIDATVIVIAHNLSEEMKQLFDKEIKLESLN